MPWNPSSWSIKLPYPMYRVRKRIRKTQTSHFSYHGCIPSPNSWWRNLFFDRFGTNDKTQPFQPLDLTVNKHCKSCLKQLFSVWYTQQIEDQLSLGKKVEDIKIEFCFTTFKPLHAKWVVEYYNEISQKMAHLLL